MVGKSGDAKTNERSASRTAQTERTPKLDAIAMQRPNLEAKQTS